MKPKLHIRRNDIVVVIAGSAAAGNKTGKVLQVWPAKGRAIVEGINFVTKCIRKSQDYPHGSIIKIEAPLNISNLSLHCPHCKKGVKVTRSRDENGVGVRKCKLCGHKFES